MRSDDGGVIVNRMTFINSIENILNVADKHPSLDVIALEKARNAVRRMLCDEMQNFRRTCESKQNEMQARQVIVSQLKFHELE